jgi:hypothetical protein
MPLMPITPSPAQSHASRDNGARSAGPVTAAGKARSSLNSVRHGLCGRTFFLLPDEDPEEFKAHEATWLAAWRPRDFAEQDAALNAIRALWREIRADRLEAEVLADLFAAGGIADEAERQAAKAAGMKALGTVLRYRARIAREFNAAMRELDVLRQRRLAPPQAARPIEPEPANRPVVAAVASTSAVPDEPELTLKRHLRRALAAMERQVPRRAA